MKSSSVIYFPRNCWSLPVRGAWVEINVDVRDIYLTIGRSPCGERGLKYHYICDLGPTLERRSPCGERGLKSVAAGAVRDAAASLPVRGAWVEIVTVSLPACAAVGRSPCGERGLKFAGVRPSVQCRRSRSPCGERGLKSAPCGSICRGRRSLPVRGAWVEIQKSSAAGVMTLCRSPCGERGLKCPVLFARATSHARRSPCGERGLK